MRQQVNLYPAAVQQVLVPYGGRVVLRTVATVAALLVLVAALLVGDTVRLAGTVRELRQRQADVARQLVEQQQRLPLRPKDPRLAEEVARLQAARDLRQPLGGMLATLTAAPATTFSPALEGLARQTPEGVWLRHISLGAADRSFTLDGSALQAEAPLRLVESLTREAAFAGVKFRHLNLLRGEAENYIDFSLSTAGGAQP